MASKLPLLLTTALLALTALASSASAATGLAQQRVVRPADPPVTTSGALLAPQVACPGGDLAAPAEAQEEAMRCMTNFAREQLGLAPFGDAPELDASAGAKAGDLLACDSFSHTACGRDFTYWMRQSGYIREACWHVGENLAWGTGEYGSVRAIFQAWMRSPTHRRNLLGNYSQLGVDLRVGELNGQPGTRVWAQHFGTRCETAPQPS